MNAPVNEPLNLAGRIVDFMKMVQESQQRKVDRQKTREIEGKIKIVEYYKDIRDLGKHQDEQGLLLDRDV